MVMIRMSDLKNESKERAAQVYHEWGITFTEAAHQARLSLWDFQHFMVDKGYISTYSLEDLSEELEALGAPRRRA